ncbi:MAG: Rpn family recombination-promoting nuclease/putative transposase [Defluviitaleaceae bacterium]|nr:Rpn family recombination-promoting nuclease/putative transposase [Defluviitaleaceae bacterium]
MTVNGQKVDVELQISDEGNYPERSLFYRAREYSTGINEGENYNLLPKTFVISILGFNQFSDPKKFYHEFKCLEVTTHEPLTDKMLLQFYELKKLPPLADTDSGIDLWLKLFNAETEEELIKIEEMGASYMSEAIMAYRHVTASSEFRELERCTLRRDMMKHRLFTMLNVRCAKKEMRIGKVWLPTRIQRLKNFTNNLNYFVRN